MKCSYCNTDLKQGAKFCPKCGREVVVNDVCINCGKPIKLGASFCPYCGANQHPQQFVQAQEDDNIQSNVEVVPSETDETALKIEQEPRSVNTAEIQSEEEQEAPPSDVVNASSKEEQEAKPVNTAETSLVEKQESKDSEDPTTEEQEVKPSNVVEDQAEVEQENNDSIEEPKKNSNIVKIAIAIVAVILLFGGGYYLYYHYMNNTTDQEFVSTDESNQEDELSYEVFLRLYEEMMSNEWQEYKLPSDYLTQIYHLEMHEWQHPSWVSHKKIIGRNVSLDGEGQLKANSKHAWCICIDIPGEEHPKLYLWMADVVDVKKIISESEKYGVLETWVESGYEGEPAELTRFAIKNAPKSGVTRVKYEELDEYQTIGKFQYESKYEANQIALGDYVKIPKEDKNVSEAYDMYGTISDYPITMHLEIDGNQVKGFYYYNRQYEKIGTDSHLTLLGSYSEGTLDLNETDKNGVPTGHFQGNLQDGVYKGEFITTNGDRLQFIVGTK